jgi:Cu(I)/Ag(I) efflux system membrane fusion protein
MHLVPIAERSVEQAQLGQRAGLETEPVTYRELYRELRTVGKLDYNERQVAYITARIAGRIERLYADFAGIQVKQNDHLVDIYSPDLLVTVRNLLDAQQGGNKTLAEMSRQRLRLWGMLPEQIREVEKSGQLTTRLTVYAPIGGTIIEKAVREGQYVKEGDMLYRIADLDLLWLYLDVYESDLAWVRFGQQVEAAVEAFPGETFRGMVTFIDPFLDDKTRTVKVRVNLPNPERKLKPAMYASAVVRVRLRPDGTPEPTGLEGKYICPMHPEVIQDSPGRCRICEMRLEQVPKARPPAEPVHAGHEHQGPSPEPGKVLAVRATAVLDTGRRKVAYRQTGDGNYELVELRVGPRAEGKDATGQWTGYYPVLGGLRPGDRAVVQGGFLLDSQTQIEGRPSLLYPQGQSAAALHAGHGGASPSPAPAPGAGHKH